METLTKFFVNLMEAEAQRSPGLVLVVCALVLISVGLLLGGNPIAMAADVKDFRESSLAFQERTKSELDGVKSRLRKVEVAVCENTKTTRKSSLEQSIRAAESEIFQLERLEKAGEARERDLTRLTNVQTDRARMVRELEDLRRKKDCDAVNE